MLPRVLEPEVMDTLEEARDYDEMDHSEVNRAFVADLLAAGPLEGEILDLGTGTARIPIELCKRCEDCRVMAVDLSINMLDLARLNIEIEGLIERIMLDRVDAKRLIHQDNRFAAVISNSIIHHIVEPAGVLAEMIRVTAPGGLLFVRDLMRPPDEPALERLVRTYAAEESRHAQEMFERSLRAALTLEEIRRMVVGFGFDGRTVEATSDRHWTWSARKPQP